MIAVCVAEIKAAFAKTHQILEFISTIVVQATTTKFVAKDKFVINTNADAPVKISGLWGNFTTWFGEKVEDLITKQTLRYAKLLKSSVDGPIIAALGGEAKAETTLTELYGLMKLQANGEEGALLNNGWANVFYIKDIAGVLRAVSVYWDDVGWLVSACSVEGPDVWHVGLQVFSRNS